MDSLNRAKRFLARKASKLAMAIVPLAALAVVVPARASIVYLDPAQTDVCNTDPGSGSCVVVQAGAPGGNSNMNWLQLSGTGSGVYSSGSYLLTFSANGGSANNASLPAGPVPVSWDFFVNASGGGSINYSVFFQLGLQTSGSYSYPDYSMSGSASPGSEITGNNVIASSGGDNVIYYDITLQLSSATPFSVTIPSGSTLDLNPVSAPEPATLWLAAAGGAVLLLRRKKRT